jgi:hypothetical protein
MPELGLPARRGRAVPRKAEGGPPVVYLRRMAIRRPEVVRFHDKGYWDAARPWPEMGYKPTAKKKAA